MWEGTQGILGICSLWNKEERDEGKKRSSFRAFRFLDKESRQMKKWRGAQFHSSRSGDYDREFSPIFSSINPPVVFFLFLFALSFFFYNQRFLIKPFDHWLSSDKISSAACVLSLRGYTVFRSPTCAPLPTHTRSRCVHPPS